MHCRHTKRINAFPVQASISLRLFATLLLVIPLSVAAQSDDGDWTWQASIYGWLPGIEGKTRFPTGGSGPTIEIDPDQLLSNLDFTFMAAIDVSNGQWGVFTDVIYLDEGATRTRFRDFTVGGRPLEAGVTADFDFDLKSWIWTAAGTYRLADSNQHVADFLVGARLFDMSQTLVWEINGETNLLPGRSGRSSASLTQWDLVAGVKGRLQLGETGRWVMPYYLDIGAGDSDFTFQTVGGLGYKFNWGTVTLMYRYLDYEMGSGRSITDFTFNGPMLGATFQW